MIRCIYCDEEIKNDEPVALVFGQPMHVACQAAFEHDYFGQEEVQRAELQAENH